MDTLGGILSGAAGAAGEAYEANQQAEAQVKTERERQRGLANVVKTALPWVVGGLIIIVFIIYVIAKKRKSA